MQARPEDVAAEAIRALTQGDRSALQRLYAAHAGRLLAVANSILRNRSEAEEILQEVFVEVWRRAREYDPRRGGVLGWLTVLARTRAIDRLRSRRVAELALAANPFSSPARRDDEEPTPLRFAEQRQEQTRVREALAQLPEEQRAVIELGYFQGLSQSEIAQHTGDPLGTVKTRVRLAMEKLQSALASLEGGSP